MRDARFVGLAADGGALIVECDGEHLRVPLDGRLHATLAGEAQMPMPLQARVSPARCSTASGPGSPRRTSRRARGCPSS